MEKEPIRIESKSDEEIRNNSELEIQQIIRSLSPQDLDDISQRIKSLTQQESLDDNMKHPDSVKNIFDTLLYDLKGQGFDFEKEISDLGAILIKLNVDHLSKYRDMIVQNLPYSSSYSINHVEYKIMGYDHKLFSPEYRKVYLAILQFLEHYYQVTGDYEYAEIAAKSLGHADKQDEFHSKMIDLIEGGEYVKLKSFDVSTEEGRKFIRESGLVGEIERIIELLGQTSIKQDDLTKLTDDLIKMIKDKAVKIQNVINSFDGDKNVL